MRFNKLCGDIIGCAIEVHRNLGPGLLESTYEHCLVQELRLNNFNVFAQKAMPVIYKGIKLDCGYRLDIIVEDQVILELKSVSEILGIHEAQLMTYMKLANKEHGLLMNFNVKLMKDGIKSYYIKR